LTGGIVRPDPWGLRHRRLYLCTPDRPDLDRFVDQCVTGGVDIVQLRDKVLPDGPLVERAAVAQSVCAHHGVPFILNDRPDLAADIGADGVHVGQDDLEPVAVRAVVGEEAIVGLSTHAPAELAAALGPEPAPVDYLSAGPVVPTPTKPGRPGTGVAYVADAARRSPWPVWITGGVTPDTVGPLVAAGARHFVVVRWLTGSDRPADDARRLRQVIDGAIDLASADQADG
jgi:thiamine-phosphate pyrophosphorylase